MSPLSTPGVYVIETAASAAATPVATAVPAFIGYTPGIAAQIAKRGPNQAVKIGSWLEFLAAFGLPDPADATGRTAAPDRLQYQPIYFAVPAANPPQGDVILGTALYDLQPDAGTVYALYSSVKLFYANGGGNCYIVSVGKQSDGPARGVAKGATEPLVNPNVSVAALLAGLAVLEREIEPTILVFPEAILLSAADNAQLNQAALAHCGKMQSRVALLDIIGGDRPNPQQWGADVAAFRAGLGMGSLNYGIAYYPFFKTTITLPADITHQNLGGGAPALRSLLPITADPDGVALQRLLPLLDQPTGASPSQLENDLLALSPVYGVLRDAILAKVNVLAPSGALAGIYTAVDAASGVWTAPANVGLQAVTDTTFNLSDADQSGLEIDPLGKSINAIRNFPDRGILVWGARTLDGNSQDWRYVNVRRTLIFIEQSMKRMLQQKVFAPNNADTWSVVRDQLTDFLTGLWSQGALVGATPAEAFSVALGLGQTMTAQDVLDGYMRVSVQLAVAHPAEFIVITLQQQMEGA